MTPEHIERGPDLAGFRVTVVQAGTCEYISIIETEGREEWGRSPRYLTSPQAALEQALSRIKLHALREVRP